MEQRIDPNTQPGYAAGTDPAYIPGLTAPATAGKPDTSQEQTDQERTKERAPGAAAPDDALAEAVSEDAAADGEAGAEAAADDKEAEDGPAFEVSDRRGSITANRDGVRFRLDDQEAEFRWDEIGAVEVKTPRFGRRFTVTVHVSTRRWFNAEVEAPARSDLKQWAGELDAVLDVYFEES
ncbi:hypothetical protein P6B95_34285 [Streptomyces atratus]|uniref:hypothetical protein n=1 Tax=Streptomyces atratus TaxID=1893 RepID=UPI0016706041|nr:hypothetical protein [Streptomyces atratus]WPW31962.1 hypothetical protein P6B95_34285 [Streptomyces atratus]GGT18723.1 hypothetical protein GCM10010207_17220 [Streptomyces atratus]